MLLKYGSFEPKLESPVFIAPGSFVIGQVELGREVSIWFNTVVRGDSDRIVIGAGSNLQDNSVVHVDEGVPVHIGQGVTIGHRAIIHGATIADEVLIGMGSIIMNHARIGTHSIIGAGSLVTEGLEIPPGSLVYGVPARIVRALNPQEITRIEQSWRHYRDLWIQAGWQFR